MNSSIKKEERTIATLIHLSVFSAFLVPLGNFIFPLILWLTKKESEFVDYHGRQALNFQISLFLYTIFLAGIALAAIIFTSFSIGNGDPHFFIEDTHLLFEDFSKAFPFLLIAGSFILLSSGLFILSIFAVISASLNASEEKLYNYPLSINFLGASKEHSSNHHQSKNEQFNNTQNQRL